MTARQDLKSGMRDFSRTLSCNKRTPRRFTNSELLQRTTLSSQAKVYLVPAASTTQFSVCQQSAFSRFISKWQNWQSHGWCYESNAPDVSSSQIIFSFNTRRQRPVMNTSRVSNPQMSIQKKQKSASLAHRASQFSRQWINIAHQKSRARQIAEKLTTASAFTIQAKNTAWYRTLLGCKHYNERTNKGCSAWRWDLLCIRVDCRRGKIVRSEKPTISRCRYGRRAKTREVHPTSPRSIWSAGLAVFTWKVWHFAIGLLEQ